MRECRHRRRPRRDHERMTDTSDSFATRGSRTTPEAIAERQFSQVKRGYAESEVRAYLRMVSSDFAAAASRERELAARVRELEEQLRKDGRFEPVVRIGSENCTRSRLLRDLGSGQYGLIHYSGHSKFDGYRSAWQLKHGHSITTNKLTSALQMQPPALVFSSSCESAEAGEPGLALYEFQTFDLPSAFLEAGVEAYVGALWEVEASAAYEFVKAFYEAFLSGENLGECLRCAKWASKQYEQARLRSDDHRIAINWLAFVLHGDPYTMPGDLFPALRKQ